MKMYPGMHKDEQESGIKDEGVLPKSDGKSLEKAGINDYGYITKKGIPEGLDARFNYLPPGMNIEDQKNSDIREQKMLEYKGGITYPGDGWT
jgi:uncharacterized protein RhaS with RHS repeats